MQNKLFGLFPIIGAVLVLFVCSIILNPGYGLSDNGDFYRIMKVNKLQFVDETDKSFTVKNIYNMQLNGDNFFEKFISTFETNDKDFYYSSHCIVISLSKSINYIVNCLIGRNENYYDVKILGIIYILLLSTATFMILSFFDKLKVRVVVLAVLLIVFCDSGYILYFNSLYGEALQFTSLMIILGAYLQMIKYKELMDFFACIISSYFFAGSKLANIPLAIVIVIGSGVIMRKRKCVWFLVLFQIIFIALMLFNIPKWMSRDTNYQAVFFGILKNSTTVEDDLKELGLPEEYAILKNTHAYMSEYPIDIHSEKFQKNFFDKIGKVDILLFYIKHPTRLVDYMCKAIKYSGSMRPLYLGNTDTGRLEITNRYSMWSYIREKTGFLHNPSFILVEFLTLIIIDMVFFCYCIKKRKVFDYFIALTILIIGAISSLIIPIIGNGDADLSKHMFLFTNFIDIIFFSIIIFCISKNKLNYLLIILPFVFLCKINFYGKTVKFGGYNWTIIDETDSGMLLICNDIVDYRKFDDSGVYGSNLWVESDLRKWLNEEIFSKEILDNAIPISHFVCTNQLDTEHIESGIHCILDMRWRLCG